MPRQTILNASEIDRTRSGEEMTRILMAFALLLAPLAAGATCYEDQDKFAGTTTHWCAMGGLGMGESLGSATRGLDPIPMAIVKADGTVEAAIKVLWRAPEWLFMQPGSKLVFIIDGGERIELTTTGGSGVHKDINTVPGAGVPVYVREEAVFLTDADTMRRLGEANRVDYAVYGAKGREERTIDKGALKHYRALYEKVIKPRL